MAEKEPPPDYTPDYNTNYGNATGAYPCTQFNSYNYPPSQSQAHFNSAVVVTQPVTSSLVATTVPDHSGLAVFACLCCFWPLGLVAIMKSTESKDLLARGDITGAVASANESRRFSLISIGIGVLVLVGVIIAVVVIVTQAWHTYYYYG